MHGAAQIAKAPPSSTREPRLRAPCTRPAPTSRSGQGSRPMKAKSEDDEDEPGDLLEQELVAEDPAADELGADAERDEDGREADHERDAREHDPSRRPALVEPVRLDGGDGREIARHERQHARGKERDESRDQRDERLRRPHGSVLVAGELLVHSPLEIRVEVGLSRLDAAVAAAAPRPGERSDDDDPDGERRERQQPGEEVEAALGRLGENGRPELVDELRLDLL